MIFPTSQRNNFALLERTGEPPHRNPVALVGTQPQFVVNDAGRGYAVECGIGFGVRQNPEIERTRVQFGDDIASVATHVICFAVDDLPCATAGRLVVLHACKNQPSPIPVNVVWHESRRCHFPQRACRVEPRVHDNGVPSKSNDVKLLIVPPGLDTVVTRQFRPWQKTETRVARTPS